MAAFSHLDDLAGNKRVRGFSQSHQHKKNTIHITLVRNPLPASKPVRHEVQHKPPTVRWASTFNPQGAKKKVSTAGLFFIFIGTKAD